MQNLSELSERINPGPVPYIDKISIRLGRRLGKRKLEQIKSDADHASIREGRPVPGGKKKFLLTIVNPSDQVFETLRFECGFINHLELALDFPVKDEAARRALFNLFEEAFVKSHHGRHELVRYHLGEVTHDAHASCIYFGQRRPGLNFVVYEDRESKVAPGRAVHLEARFIGSAAVRRAGVTSVDDLMDFDYHDFWKRHLRLIKVDLALLGRLHWNRQNGRKRKTVDVFSRGTFDYHTDIARGSVLYRNLARHDYDDVYSSQLFIDRFGRGSFLKELDVSPLLPAEKGRGQSYCLYPRNEHVRYSDDSNR